MIKPSVRLVAALAFVLLAFTGPAHADFCAKAGSTAANTGTGDQTFTTTGCVPKVAVTFVTSATATGTVDHAVISVGAGTSSSAMRAATLFAEDNAATTAVAFSHQTNQMYQVINNAGTESEGGNLVSVGAGGAAEFVLNVDNGGAAVLVNWFVMGGSDLTNVAVVGDTVPASSGSNSHTPLSFQPQGLIIFMETSSATMPQSAGGNGRWQMGFTDCATAGTVGGVSPDNLGAENSQSRLATGVLLAALDVGDTQLWDGAFVSCDATGYTINWDQVSSGRHFFVIAFRGPQVKVGTWNSPTSATTVDLSASFTPQALLAVSANGAASANARDDMEISIGVATASNERFAVWFGCNDAADPTECNTDVDTAEFMKFITAGGTPTLNATAEFTQFLTDAGARLTYGSADATARQGLYMLIGPAAAGGGGGTRRPMIISRRAWLSPLMDIAGAVFRLN